MKKLSEILSKELFLNGFKISKDVCLQEYLLDINLILIKDFILNLDEKKVEQYYDDVIATDMVYSMPELFSTDIVSVPKNLTSTRQYRFFSAYSYILYNSIGLLFIDCTSELIEKLNFSKNNIFTFYPTRFSKNENIWKASHSYKEEYRGFLDKLKEFIKPNDIVLSLDISKYFDSVNHKKLINLLNKYSLKSILAKYNYSNNSNSILEFYFESLMESKYGIPQGRKNLVSDYFGFLYLLPLETEIKKLAKSKILSFKGLIRYVDDMYVIFEAKEINLKKKYIFKELLNIEAKLSSFLENELGLMTNGAKTLRKIVKDESSKNDFIEETKKVISTPNEENIENNNKKIRNSDNLNIHYENFIKSLAKLKIDDENHQLSFQLSKEDKENLKVIFDDKFKNYIFRKENKLVILEKLQEIDFELISDYINILVVLFFVKDSKKSEQPFFKDFIEFLNKLKILDDKRFIHLLFALTINKNNLINKNEFDNIEKNILKNKDKLLKDNYGKYLILLYAKYTNLIGVENEKFICLQRYSIFNRIKQEYLKKNTREYKYLFMIENNDYISLFDEIIKNYKEKEALIRQIKYFVYSFKMEKWLEAFNYFHNIFHETCKINNYGLEKESSVNNIIKTINHLLDLNEEIYIYQFYNRRNFNIISHPSQKGIPALKVDYNDLIYYLKLILPIIIKILKFK